MEQGPQWDSGTSSSACSESPCGTPTPSEEGADPQPTSPGLLSEGENEPSAPAGVTTSQSDRRLPFRCEFCGCNFKHKRSRDRHLKLHTGDRKYKCPHCESAFSRSDHFKIHLKTHNGEKPYQCNYCSRRFSSTATLATHNQSHGGPMNSKNVVEAVLHDEGGEGKTQVKSMKDTPQEKEKRAHEEKLQEKNSQGNLKLEVKSQGNGKEKITPEEESRENLKSSSSESLEGCHADHDFKGFEKEVGNETSNKEVTDISRSDNGQDDQITSEVVIRPERENSSDCSNANKTSLEKNSPIQPSSSSSFNSTIGNIGNKTISLGQNRECTSELNVSNDCPRLTKQVQVVPKEIKNEESIVVGSNNSPIASGSSANFASQDLTRAALLSLIRGPVLSCPLCSMDHFSNSETLFNHIQTEHECSVNSDHLSSMAYRPTTLIQTLYGSIESPNGVIRQITCELCGTRVADITSLQHHVVTAHSFTDLLARTAEGVFCAQCLLPFSNPGALSEHIKLVHATPLAPALSLFSNVVKRPPSPNAPEGPTDLTKKIRKDKLEEEVSITKSLSSPTLMCSQCDASFHDFESFRSHLKMHLELPENNQNFSCPECHAYLNSEAGLEVHLASHYEMSVVEYECSACAKAFGKPDELQKHLLDMHAHHLYRCSLCRQVFDSKVAVQVHFAVSHSNETKAAKCLKCSLKFSSRSEFVQHLRKSHTHKTDSKNGVTPFKETSRSPSNSSTGEEKPTLISSSSGGGYRCLLCTVSVSTEAEMNTHLSTHKRQFRCSLCEESFHVEFLMDRHMQSVHSDILNGINSSQSEGNRSKTNEISNYRCGVCDTSFPSEVALSLHRKHDHNMKSPTIKSNTSALSLFCAYCNEVCKSRNELESHMKAAHVGISNGRHKCNICDEIFPSAAILSHHKLSHVKVLTGSPSCAVCREILPNSDEVKIHQVDHYPKAFPQPCVICHQTLHSDVELSIHATFHIPGVGQSPDANGETSSSGSNDDLSSKFCLLPSKCFRCHIKFETVEDWKTHYCSHRPVNSTNEKMKIRDTICVSNKNTPAPLPTRTDADKRKETKFYQCIKCQQSFNSENEIETHVATHLKQDGSFHPCHLCHSQLDTPLRLQCHLIEHTFEGCGAFTCYLCASLFTTAVSLQQHMLTHGLDSKPYDCSLCPQSFFFRCELENHSFSHADRPPHENKISQNTLEERRAEPTHSLNTSPIGRYESVQGHQIPHSNATGIVNKCQVSSPTGTRQASLSPLEVVDEKNPRVCSTCGRRCKSAASRLLHSLTHEGGKPYLCSTCGQGFTRRCEAARHPSSHMENSEEKSKGIEGNINKENDKLDKNEKSDKKSGDFYSCFSCDTSFRSCDSLMSHVTSSHAALDKVIVRPDSRCSSCDGDF